MDEFAFLDEFDPLLLTGDEAMWCGPEIALGLMDDHWLAP